MRVAMKAAPPNRRQLESRSGCLLGPAGISGPELDPGQPYEANCLRVLGVQRQMLVAMGHVIGFNGTIQLVAGHGQIAPPERAHAEEIPALGPGDRIMTLVVEEGLSKSTALVAAPALKPGEATTAPNPTVNRTIELAAKR